MDLSVLRRWLQTEEGLSRIAYPDSRGILTLGYGHRLSVPISVRAADLILDDDIGDMLGALPLRFPWVNRLNDIRQAVLGDMAYNLGVSGLAAFTQMLAAVQAGDYATAADQMLQSAWATQVGTRAHVLAERMRTGVE
jgi:lysozyme